MIDSPETLKALEYAKELYANFIPGTLSWLDPNNNKAFLDGQISVTNNGISIYYAAKNSPDPKVKEMAADINHAVFPVGPVGVPTESHLFFNQMIMKYTKYPQAAKEFLRFMMERSSSTPGCRAPAATSRSRCAAYEKNPIWTSDPKNTPYRDAVKNMRPAGYAGKLGYASAGAAADFIVLEHGGRGGQRLEDAEGSDGARRRSAPSATTRSDAAAALRAMDHATGQAAEQPQRPRASCSCCRRRCCCCCS